jgi:hypothetical protein
MLLYVASKVTIQYQRNATHADNEMSKETALASIMFLLFSPSQPSLCMVTWLAYC